MKKYALLVSTILLYGSAALAADLNLRSLDTDTRSAAPNSNSIMFRRNAEQYRQLTPDEKAEIERQREIARKQAEEYRRQQEAYMRRQAQLEAQRRAEEEAERQRREALKPITLYGGKLKIYALVNGEVITSSEMQSRINAFIVATGIPYNAQTKNMIINKVLQAAIDEKLKIQEAKKNGIRVSQKEIDTAVARFEKANNIPRGELRHLLAESKVSMKVWTTQIEAELAWQKLMRKKALSYAHVSESEITQAIDDVRKDMTVKKYMLSEIVINKKDAKDIYQLAEVLQQDPRFSLYAMQFSQSPSAANGGSLGWVAQGRLPAPLENVFSKLKEGQVSKPVAYGNDYYIFKLEKIFHPDMDKNAELSRDGVRQFLQNKKLEDYSIKAIKDLRNRALIEKKL
jgi:parvulin-like peptidyl-prolyl isomerase